MIDLACRLTMFAGALVMALFAWEELREGPGSLVPGDRQRNPALFWTIVSSEILMSLALSAAATLS